MFLIAKIVRGRRLLHELEQQEKEKEREEREREERERALAESAAAKSDEEPKKPVEESGDERRASAPKKKTPQSLAVEDLNDEPNVSTSAEELGDSGLRRRKTWTVERTMRLVNELSRRGSRTFSTIRRRSSRLRRNESESSVIGASEFSDVMQSQIATAKFLVESTDFALTNTGEIYCSEDAVEEDVVRDGEYNLWFEDYSKALRQKTDTTLGLDRNDPNAAANERLRRTSSMPSVVEALHRAVAAGDKLKHYNYDAKLNKLQKRALRFTWHRLQTRNGGKRVDNVFEEIYDRLMRQLPSMREMFTTRTFLSAMSRHDVATLRDHARSTVKMFETVIKNLDTDDRKRTDTLSEYDPILIGKAHTCLRPYGFVSSMWEKLGETIIDVVLVQEAVRDLPGAGQAWVVLTACVVDQLRAGFEQSRDHYSRYIPGSCPMPVQHTYPSQCPHIGAIHGQPMSLSTDNGDCFYANGQPQQQQRRPSTHPVGPQHTRAHQQSSLGVVETFPNSYNGRYRTQQSLPVTSAPPHTASAVSPFHQLVAQRLVQNAQRDIAAAIADQANWAQHSTPVSYPQCPYVDETTSSGESTADGEVRRITTTGSRHASQERFGTESPVYIPPSAGRNSLPLSSAIRPLNGAPPPPPPPPQPSSSLSSCASDEHGMLMPAVPRQPSAPTSPHRSPRNSADSGNPNELAATPPAAFRRQSHPVMSQTDLLAAGGVNVAAWDH